MAQNSLLLDAEIAYYHTLCKIVQYKKTHLKGLTTMANRILTKEVHV